MRDVRSDMCVCLSVLYDDSTSFYDQENKTKIGHFTAALTFVLICHVNNTERPKINPSVLRSPGERHALLFGCEGDLRPKRTAR